MLNHYTTPPNSSELYSELFFCQIRFNRFARPSGLHIYDSSHIMTINLL